MPSHAAPAFRGRGVSAILIGASTGGVEALHHLLAALPPDSPPICVVQHMRAGFGGGFVAGLARATNLPVQQASHGMPARMGHVYVAPDSGRHLVLAQGADGLTCRLVNSAAQNGHKPSVDVLFTSALALRTPPIAILLTGMGRDGADGMLALHQAGAMTLAQDQASAVVWGMPRAAIELGGAGRVLPLGQMAAAISRLCRPAPQPQ